MATAKETRHAGLGLDPERLLAMYRQMVLARAVDRRMWVLNRQGKAPFVISGQGHEAVQVAAANAMIPGKDWLVPYYRDLAFCLALGMSARDFLLSVYGRAEDPNSGGRQMPSHFGSSRLRIITKSSVVGTQDLAVSSRRSSSGASSLTKIFDSKSSPADRPRYSWKGRA